jgi:hypothetical protein
MLKFADLTKSQKTFVVRTLELFPEYRSEKTLGAKQIHASYYKMKDERGSTGEKLGYPNWLQSKNRVGRGEYQMPWPTDAELSAFAQGSVKQPKVKTVKVAKAVVKKQESASRLQKIVEESPVYDDDVEDFNQILRENGIEV